MADTSGHIRVIVNPNRELAELILEEIVVREGSDRLVNSLRRTITRLQSEVQDGYLVIPSKERQAYLNNQKISLDVHRTALQAVLGYYKRLGMNLPEEDKYDTP